MRDEQEPGEVLTERDRERHARMAFTGDKYPNCRQRDKTTGVCSKHGHHPGFIGPVRPKCPTCRTCPVCGGTLSHDRREEVVDSQHIKPVTEATCVHCGAWMERDIHQPQRARQSLNRDLPPMCAVATCKGRAWDGLTIEVGERRFTVCDRHKGAHLRWTRGGSDKDKRHLEVVNGRLILIPAKMRGEKVQRLTKSERGRLGAKVRAEKQLEREKGAANERTE